MTYLNSNLSSDEIERMAYLKGTAGSLFLASVLDATAGLEAATEAASDALAHISEARGSFMPEDFLSEEFAELRAIAAGMRKGGRTELEDLLQRMEERRDEQAGQSEYGADELDKAYDALEV